jgi:hypothetical protein
MRVVDDRRDPGMVALCITVHMGRQGSSDRMSDRIVRREVTASAVFSGDVRPTIGE